MPTPQDLERLRAVFRDAAPGEQLSVEELAARLPGPPLQGNSLQAAIKTLLRQDELVRLRGGALALRPRAVQVEGRVRRSPRGHGLLDTGTQRLYVPAGELGRVVDGDRVQATLDLDRRGRLLAVDLQVLVRERARLVGTTRRVGDSVLVEAHDGRFGEPVLLRDAAGVAPDQLVEVELEPAPARDTLLCGRLLRVIGEPGATRAEVTRILVNRGVIQEHPDEAEAEAAALDAGIDLTGRVDLRDRLLVTIDGEDACDFDDAVAVESVDDGLRLTVAIADVAEHVAPGGAVDREAIKRSTSIYWPGGVAHMLPERLAADLCSLRPEVDRLAVVCELYYGPGAELQRAELCEAVIRSRARLTYPQVNAALGGDAATRASLDTLWPVVEQLGALSKRLEQQARDAGRLDLDIPEPVFELDAEGEPIDARARPMGPAERLIETFMVAANQAVAQRFQARKLPTLYRVHPAPDRDRLQPFAEAAQALTGQRVEAGSPARQLSATLRLAEQDSDRRLLSSLLLRCLPQARYDVRPLGHYGLGTPDYLHFTSPIRRYPDLLVHRVLKADLRGKSPQRLAQAVEAAADAVNSREREAMELERMIDAMLSTQLASAHLGELHHATITGIAPVGLFARVEHPLLEGFVRADGLQPADYYRRSDDGLSLVGRRKGWRYRLGDAIEVRLLEADPVKRQVEMTLVEGGQQGRVEPQNRKPEGGQGRGKTGRRSRKGGRRRA